MAGGGRLKCKLNKKSIEATKENKTTTTNVNYNISIIEITKSVYQHSTMESNVFLRYRRKFQLGNVSGNVRK